VTHLGQPGHRQDLVLVPAEHLLLPVANVEMGPQGLPQAVGGRARHGEKNESMSVRYDHGSTLADQARC